MEQSSNPAASGQGVAGVFTWCAETGFTLRLVTINLELLYLRVRHTCLSACCATFNTVLQEDLFSRMAQALSAPPLIGQHLLLVGLVRFKFEEGRLVRFRMRSAGKTNQRRS